MRMMNAPVCNYISVVFNIFWVPENGLAIVIDARLTVIACYLRKNESE